MVYGLLLCLTNYVSQILLADNPKQLVKIGVQLDDGCISAARRLPDTKTVKNCIIVKIVRRDKREEVKTRKNLIGKKSSNLALVTADMGKGRQDPC